MAILAGQPGWWRSTPAEKAMVWDIVRLTWCRTYHGDSCICQATLKEQAVVRAMTGWTSQH